MSEAWNIAEEDKTVVSALRKDIYLNKNKCKVCKTAPVGITQWKVKTQFYLQENKSDFWLLRKILSIIAFLCKGLPIFTS